jgi:TonB family protein
VTQINQRLHRTERTAASSRDTSTLSLRVERSSGDLLVTWNRNSEAIRGATHAVLAIGDGERHENVELDRSRLKNGSVAYSPSNSEVSFQLTVTGRNASQIQSESVRVLRMSPLATPNPPAASAERPVPKRTSAANALALTTSRASRDTGAGLAKAPHKAAPRPFQAASLAQRLQLAQPTNLSDAPGLAGRQQPQAVVLPGNTVAPMPPPVVQVPPVSQPQPPVTAPPGVPGARVVGGQVREAQILTQTPPEYPLAARQGRVQGSVVVSAVVGVDGHIKSTIPLSGPPLLQNSAIQAVKQWVHKPATLDGIPIESETRIELNFTLQPVAHVQERVVGIRGRTVGAGNHEFEPNGVTILAEEDVNLSP